MCTACYCWKVITLLILFYVGIDIVVDVAVAIVHAGTVDVIDVDDVVATAATFHVMVVRGCDDAPLRLQDPWLLLFPIRHHLININTNISLPMAKDIHDSIMKWKCER